MDTRHYNLISDIFDTLANNKQYCTSEEFAAMHDICIDYQKGIITVDDITLTINYNYK